MSDIRQKSSRGTLLPCLNRIDFYRLTEGELISALAEAISGFREGNRNGKLTDDHPAVCAWARLSIDVPNGGFTQFFFNHGGEVGIESAADLFEALELTKAGALLRDAVAIYRAHRRAFAVDTPWDGLFGSI